MGPPYMMSCWNLGFDLACKFFINCRVAMHLYARIRPATVFNVREGRHTLKTGRSVDVPYFLLIVTVYLYNTTV